MSHSQVRMENIISGEVLVKQQVPSLLQINAQNNLKLIQVLQEAPADRVAELKALANDLIGTGGITGQHKERAAFLLREYARLLRLARTIPEDKK